MQIDFSSADNWSCRSGWLDKRGSIRKNWKTRYFYLSGGILRYYAKGPALKTNEAREGVDMRGEISLLGADISIFEETQLHLTLLQGEKKTVFHLRTKDNIEATEWHVAITSDIKTQNIKALRDHSRIPEVVEWYYQYQSELNRKFSFLGNNAEANLYYNVGSGRQSSESISAFNISMNQERTGLVMSIVATGKKFNRIESINNGRIILFVDVVGAIVSTNDSPNALKENAVFNGNQNLPAEGWTLNSVNKFRFTLVTKEDELSFEMEPFGVTWLQAVRDMSIFMKIPKPSARSNIYSPPRASNTTMNSLIEFSANSGAVFACASDIPLIIEGFNQVSTKSPIITEIGARIQSILKLIPELKSNKEAALNFGERIEEMTRALGDTDVGILYQAREGDKSLLNFHLSTLHGKLQDAINYLTIQSRSGWLVASVMSNSSLYSSSTSDNAKAKFDHFDHELISIINALIKAQSSHNSSLVVFDKKEYSMAVDVKKSIEALGGIEAIYHDGAKERALARLIQADGQDIHHELVEFIRMSNVDDDRSVSRSSATFTGFMTGGGSGPRNSAANSDRSSFSSFHTSQDYSAGGATNGKKSVWRFFCCCSRKAKYGSTPNRKKSNIQLEEPLVT